MPKPLRNPKKRHKKYQDVPVRSIVNAFISPRQKLKKHLANIMQPPAPVEKAKSFIKNTEHFTRFLSTTANGEEDIVARFDVKSLYPIVPIDEALEQIWRNTEKLKKQQWIHHYRH